MLLWCRPLIFPGRLLSTSDRSLIQFYPNFKDQLRDSLRHLVGKKVEEAVEIGMAKDGSGVGGKPICLSPPQQTMSKPFISCFGCPHCHASSLNLICKSPKITTDLPRIGRLVRIQKQVLFEFVVPCSVFSFHTLLLLSSIYLNVFDLLCGFSAPVVDNWCIV